VKNHKTVTTHGYAKLCLQEHLFNNLKIFVRHVRSLLPGNDPHVFLTSMGRKITSGEVSTQLNSIWQRSGVYGSTPRPKKNISCTQFRKSASTMVLEHKPEVSRQVADLLAHGTGAQEKYYDCRRRHKSSAIDTIQKQESVEESGNSPTVEIPTSSPSRRQWSIPEIEEIQLLFSNLISGTETFGISDVSNVEEKFQLLNY